MPYTRIRSKKYNRLKYIDIYTYIYVYNKNWGGQVWFLIFLILQTKDKTEVLVSQNFNQTS